VVLANRFLDGGIAALHKDAPLPGRTRTITDGQVTPAEVCLFVLCKSRKAANHSITHFLSRLQPNTNWHAALNCFQKMYFSENWMKRASGV